MDEGHAATARRTSIPDLSFYDLAVVLNAACCELDTDSRLGVEVEFVPREAAQKVGLSNARVADDDHCTGERAGTAFGIACSRLVRARRAPCIMAHTLEKVVVVIVRACRTCG